MKKSVPSPPEKQKNQKMKKIERERNGDAIRFHRPFFCISKINQVYIWLLIYICAKTVNFIQNRFRLVISFIIVLFTRLISLSKTTDPRCWEIYLPPVINKLSQFHTKYYTSYTVHCLQCILYISGTSGYINISKCVIESSFLQFSFALRVLISWRLYMCK